jgi:putative iron-regulated protein
MMIKDFKALFGAASLAAALVFTGCAGEGEDGKDGQDATTSSPEVTSSVKTSVLTTYANIALANYTDALNDAKALQTALTTFAGTPTEANMDAAQAAWLQARESYGTTEIFRLANGPIDAEAGWVADTYGAPEGMMNAWPLDENMIDYTKDATGATTSGNIIDTAGSFTPSGDDATAVDVTTIEKADLEALNENGGDANVATGYHAIEFLLWGQDQDYSDFTADTVTTGPMQAGDRPVTDYTSAANADRRKAYLNAAADLLVDNLQTIVDAWKTDSTTNYRAALLGYHTTEANNIATDTALKQIMSGMGVFIKSELANERMAVAIQTPSEEDEHSCFSDNTHRDIFLNYKGFINVLKAQYEGETEVAGGTAMYDYLPANVKADVDELIARINEGVSTINITAEEIEHFDYQIKSSSVNRQNAYDTKNLMRDLGDQMIDVAKTFGISLTADDVIDPDETQI